jgi:hypothetical protein
VIRGVRDFPAHVPLLDGWLMRRERRYGRAVSASSAAATHLRSGPYLCEEAVRYCRRR